MNQFKIGTNFDLENLKVIVDLNDRYEKKNKITEMYGSIAADADYAARPEFRLPDIDRAALEKYVQTCNDNNIEFNYTLNSINPCGSKTVLWEARDRFKKLVMYLYEIGVKRVTVSNPVLLELIRELPIRMSVEISTIAHVDTVTQIKYYKDKYDVDKICANLNKNRDFAWLKAAAKYCNENNIKLELMANEFCGVGSEDYATHCIYRDSCYICHATNKTKEDSLLFDNYPMNLCTQGRNKNPVNWLRSKFIRPEDVHYYNDIGIKNFKLTGRTATSEYLKKICEAYLSGKYDGNLIALWKPLESINLDKSEDFTVHNIDNAKLDGFLSFWAENAHVCDNEVCGETCHYCDNFYKMRIKE